MKAGDAKKGATYLFWYKWIVMFSEGKNDFSRIKNK